jgi:Pyruvate/2-oxoacid:ferredoxin oxidoreductase gamma subunit
MQKKSLLDNNLVFGGEPFINVPMLGALCRVLDLPFSVLEETLKEQWSENKALPNINAAREAYDTVWKAGVPKEEKNNE